MRTSVFTLTAALTLALCAPALAVPGLSYICNSAGPPNGEALVHVDVGTEDCDQLILRLLHSSDAQSTWTEVPMARLGTPGFDSTWQGEIPLGSSGTVHYYLNGDDGRHHATQSPFNSGNTWPPGANLFGRVALDDTGDAIQPEGPYLDLTGAFVGYSSDRFYFMLTNNDDEWPTSGGILKWHSYSLGFANPAAPSDSWVFAPVYVDAWPVMQHGLFAVNRYSGEIPERVGDIAYHTVGNRLIMRCEISGMTGDPRFGPWPNQYGYLYAAANTQTITVSGAAVRDTTATGLFYAPRTPRLTVEENTMPVLSQAGVVPRIGTSGTVFRFGLYYADADTHLPVRRSLVVDEDTFELVPSSHRYWDRALFSLNRSGFGPGLHWFHFSFDDGISVAATPPDTFRVTGTGVAEQSRTESGGLRVMPALFRRGVAFLGVRQGDAVEIVNSSGAVVAELSVSSTSVVWDGRDRSGVEVPAGAYFVRTLTRPGGCVRVVKVK